jgi:hypothetical protein
MPAGVGASEVVRSVVAPGLRRKNPEVKKKTRLAPSNGAGLTAFFGNQIGPPTA